jgi:hypothetical protein
VKGEIARDTFNTTLFDGSSLTVEDAFKHMRLSGRWWEEMIALARGLAIRGLAAELGITTTDDELQRAVDAYRSAAGLYDAAETEAWLGRANLTLEDLEAHVELGLLEGHLAAALPEAEIAARQSVPPDDTLRDRIAAELLDERLRGWLDRNAIKRREIFS